MEFLPNPWAHIALAVVGLVACVYDLLFRELPDWLTIGGVVLGLGVALGTGGWDGLLLSVAGLACGLGVFWLLWTLGMMGSGDVLLMGACGALLGWPLVLWGLLHAALTGALLGLVYSLVRGHLVRVFRNLWTVVVSTLNPRKKRVKMAELETDELPYGVAIALGCGWAALLPYLPELRIF